MEATTVLAANALLQAELVVQRDEARNEAEHWKSEAERLTEERNALVLQMAEDDAAAAEVDD